jgi:nucleoside-diphosphate-sugar epimerase
MNEKDQVLVTGANGFVGSALCRRLQKEKWPVRALVRSSHSLSHNISFTDTAFIDDIGVESDLATHLEGIRTVVHLAARVHVMHDTAVDPLLEFKKINTNGTIALANVSVRAGVKRFVYLSTIKVNGEQTFDYPFSADVPVHPIDPYAVSKWEAEQKLHEIGRETGLEIVIVRPPLVYGPMVKANFLKLMRLVDKGLVLPFGSIKNKRSMIYIDNLVDFLMCCIAHPVAVNETFLVSDGDDLSTPQLIGLLAKHLGKPDRLIPFPPGLLKGCAKLLGKGNVAERLFCSLQIDIRKAKKKLNWQPPFTVDYGLMKTGRWYKEKLGS